MKKLAYCDHAVNYTGFRPKGDPMDPISPVFEKHYRDYLQRLKSLDFDSLSWKLGGQVHKSSQGKVITLSFFGRFYEISPQGIRNRAGQKPGYDICIILCRYLLMCPQILPHDRQWVNFRDLKDSGPLTVYFRNNVEEAIAARFEKKLPELQHSLAAMDGYAPDLNVRYDLAMQVDALPKIPLLVLFNDADEGFPAECSLLFEGHVETFLDAECIAMVGSRLFARLKHGGEE